MAYPRFVNLTVPNVLNLGFDAAINLMSNAGLIVQQPTIRSFSGSVAQGLCLSQTPAGGSSVPPGTPVTLGFSLGVQPVPGPAIVPNMLGLTYLDATRQLSYSGLSFPSVPLWAFDTPIPGTTDTIVYTTDNALITTDASGSSTDASDQVVAQSIAAGTSVALGTQVTLTINTGFSG